MVIPGRMTTAAALAAALTVALTGCGEDSAEEGTPPPTPAETTTAAPAEPPPASDGLDIGAVHVHGLGVDPADGALMIATHTGLWRLDPGASWAERVGESRQDTMGFTVVGPNRFLGSGHPDPAAAEADDLPPLLGLIESTDGGESWTPVSLWGEADFHVLRAAGRQVYGFDATSGRLLASADGGETWDERATPGLLLDLVVDPTDPARLVAAGERGLAESLDGGATWEVLAPGLLGFLAWDASGHLYLVDGGGRIALSPGGRGRTWRFVGSVESRPAAFLADRGALYVALHDGSIRMSRDRGITWTLRGST